MASDQILRISIVYYVMFFAFFVLTQQHIIYLRIPSFCACLFLFEASFFGEQSYLANEAEAEAQ